MKVKIDRNELWPVFFITSDVDRFNAGEIEMTQEEVEEWTKIDAEWDKWQSLFSKRLQETGGKWC